MPPLADAVRLVHGDEADAAARQVADEALAVLGGQPFRRHIEQPVTTFADALQDRHPLVGWQRAVEAGRRHAVRGQAVDLILHQRDERRDDQREPWTHQRRGLEAERLAAAGGKHDDRIPVVEDRLHRLALQRPEGAVAPVALQRLEEGVFRRSGLRPEPRLLGPSPRRRRALRASVNGCHTPSSTINVPSDVACRMSLASVYSGELHQARA